MTDQELQSIALHVVKAAIDKEAIWLLHVHYDLSRPDRLAMAAQIAAISERLHAEIIAPAPPPRPSIAELTWHPGLGPHRGRKRHRTLPTLLSIAGLAPYAAAPDVLPFFGTPGAGLPFSACSWGFSLTGPLATFRAVGPLRAGRLPTRARLRVLGALQGGGLDLAPPPQVGHRLRRRG